MQKMEPKRRKWFDAPANGCPQRGPNGPAINEVCFDCDMLKSNDHLRAVDLHLLRGQVDAKTLAFEAAIARPVMLRGALMVLAASV